MGSYFPICQKKSGEMFVFHQMNSVKFDGNESNMSKFIRGTDWEAVMATGK